MFQELILKVPRWMVPHKRTELQQHKINYGQPKRYRGVLSKWDIFIKMRIAESPPSLDLERSFYNKSILFLDKNHFFFYYLKLLIPLIPLIQGFEDLFCSSILFSQKERKGKSGSIGVMGSACFAAVLILLQQAINKGSVWNWTNWPDLCCGLWFSMKW